MHLLTGICCVGFLLFPMGIFFEVFPQVVALKLAQWVSFGSVVTSLTTAQKKVNAAAVQLDDKQRAIIMQWCMYGGVVAGVGLLLPHIIPRRKKDNRWMN